MNYREIETAVAATGLTCRGGFHPRPDDGVPGTPATLVMVGNAGPAMWEAFAATRRAEADPLDAWTRRVLDRVAESLGALTLYPFGGPPYLPFQRWAQRADAVHPSPVGPLIHPDFGLWHAYRGALAFAERLALPSRDERPSPCARCAERPCLSACPVDAFAPGRYDVPACVAHLTAAAGVDCMDGGCRARLACPVGRAYAYGPDQARFHMDAFVRAQLRRTGT